MNADAANLDFKLDNRNALTKLCRLNGCPLERLPA
jgi:hypothetical protein